MLRRLLQDPAAREAIEFERSLARPSRRRWRFAAAGAAIAAAILVAALIPLLGDGDATLARARASLRSGDVAAAVACLEQDGVTSGEGAALLAAARFASGDADPRRGLALDPAGIEILPPTAAELAAKDPGDVRAPAGAAASVETPRASILEERPSIVVRRSASPLRLRVVRLDDRQVLFETAVDGGEAGSRVEVPFSVGAAPVRPGVRHGVELRTPEGDMLGWSDFELADAGARERCAARVAEIGSLIADPVLRAESIGYLYLNRQFYGAAVRALEGIPADRLSPTAARSLDIARRQLLAR